MAAAIVANLGLRSMPLSVDCTEILVVYADKSTIADMMDDVVFLRMDEGGLSYYEEDERGGRHGCCCFWCVGLACVKFSGHKGRSNSETQD
jgi:hypothetical protein